MEENGLMLVQPDSLSESNPKPDGSFFFLAILYESQFLEIYNSLFAPPNFKIKGNILPRPFKLCL